MFALVAAAFAVGCSSTTGDVTGADGGTADASDAGACANSGKGTLTINVTGLPAGVLAKVSVTGPAGASSVEATKTISDAAGGAYTVSAEKVVQTDPIVRTAFAPKVSMREFCLGDAATQVVDVAYGAIATSNKLWITNANATSGELLGFASSTLAATGSPAATVAAKGPVAKDIAFDKDGNLWTLGGTTADAPVARFAAADLGASGTKDPDRKVNIESTCSPSFSNLAFDGSDNLWVTSTCDKKIMRLTPTDLAGSGTVTPAVVVSGMDAPAGVAFDKSGNLWVADSGNGHILRYNASRLASSTSGAPDLSITAQTAGMADLPPSALAFDAAGNLWATNFGGNVIYKLTPAELGGTGNQTITPSIQVTVGVTALLEHIAFDEAGAMWTAFTQGKIAKLTPAQLGVSSSSGSPTNPDVVLTSTDIGYSVGMAFYPAPANLPLYHRLP